MKALILAAGIGKRLKLKTPKILLKIGNKTLISLENWPKYNNKKIDPKFEAIEEISF